MDQSPRAHPSALFALPLVLAGLLAVAVVGLLIASWIGRPATGQRVTIQLISGCPDAWAALVEARGASVGLGTPERSIAGDMFTYTATYPGLDDDLEAIPRLLTAPGALAVRAGPDGEALASRDDVTDVHLDLDLRVHPRVELTFQPQVVKRMVKYSRGPAPGEGQPLVVDLDGEVIETFQDPRGWPGVTLDLQPERETLREEIRHATDWSILLRHGEAPCALRKLTVAAALAP